MKAVVKSVESALDDMNRRYKLKNAAFKVTKSVS